MSTSELKKAKKSRDKALKDVFAFEGRFNLKFLAQWSQTHNFRHWLETHDNQLLAALSPQSPKDEEATLTIHYENGDYYKGQIVHGRREGHGFYYDRISNQTYSGEWLYDKRHGHGTLCSED